jgi:hypothetical protein
MSAHIQSIPYPLLSNTEAATLIAESPEPMWVKSPAGRYLWLNDAASAVAPGIGKTDAEVFGPELAAEFRESEERALTTGQPQVRWNSTKARDYHIVVFRATWRGMPVVVGYGIRTA